ncbi:MAG: hypothetical protein CSB48_10220 [Proteobacteria bacterium]|nr:MAG: hypothetical protein CSB48_10220 [Pseudomonadota bacterium]
MACPEKEVTVVIPTTGETVRLNCLENAIGSVCNQSGVMTVPLVMLNGTIYNREIRNRLSTDGRIRFFYEETPSLPNAIHEARKKVNTEYFCYLDDDDVLIEDTVQRRLAPFEADSTLDVVVSNGYKQKLGNGNKKLFFSNIVENRYNPMYSLMTGNWLVSCGGLFKTESIGPEYFDRHQKYYEWTYIAYKLAKDKHLYFLDEPTFIVNESDISLSKRENYLIELPIFLNKLLLLESPPEGVKPMLREKIANSHNCLATYYLGKGCYKKALKSHWDCITIIPQGIKYHPWIVAFLRKAIFRHRNH